MPQNPHRYKPPPALRLARRIHDLITQRHQQGAHSLNYPLDRLLGRLEQLVKLRWHLALAWQKGWSHAQEQLLRELGCVLRSLPGETRSAELAIPRTLQILPMAELAKEFDQMDEEFGGWDYESPGILVVATEPITLEEIPLGVFEIRLNLEHLGQTRSSAPYDLVARTPHPPSSNELVIHPHVRDRELCAGDAAVPIQAALAEGRICDFFLLVRSVLQTYNPHSAHVPLANWHGSPCHDCGRVMDDDNNHYCQGCDRDFCESCISYCRCCDDSRCLSCLENCPQCDESTCISCLEACKVCGKPHCRNCLEVEVCPDCLEKKHDPQEQGKRS